MERRTVLEKLKSSSQLNMEGLSGSARDMEIEPFQLEPASALHRVPCTVEKIRLWQAMGSTDCAAGNPGLGHPMAWAQGRHRQEVVIWRWLSPTVCVDLCLGVALVSWY